MQKAKMGYLTFDSIQLNGISILNNFGKFDNDYNTKGNKAQA